MSLRTVVVLIVTTALVASPVAASISPGPAVPQATSNGFTLDTSATTAAPNGSTTIDLTVTNNGQATAAILNLTGIPEGWSVDSHSDDGGTYSAGDGYSKWLWQTVESNASVKPNVSLSVPGDAAFGTYNMTATIVLEGADNVVKDVSVTVASPLSVTSSDTRGYVDGSATVTYTVTNGKTSTASAILDVSGIPSGWTVSSRSDAGATWNSNDTKWLWNGIDANASVSPSITFAVPNGTAVGNYTLSASLTHDDGVVDSVNTSVNVTEKKPVKDAVAGDDGEIDDFEILDAVDHWRNDQEVPGAGETLSDIEILDLINSWRSS